MSDLDTLHTTSPVDDQVSDLPPEPEVHSEDTDAAGQEIADGNEAPGQADTAHEIQPERTFEETFQDIQSAGFEEPAGESMQTAESTEQAGQSYGTDRTEEQSQIVDHNIQGQPEEQSQSGYSYGQGQPEGQGQPGYSYGQGGGYGQNHAYGPQGTPPPAGGYYNNGAGKKNGNAMATASLILGILSVVMCCCGGFGIILGAVGLVLAILSRGREPMETSAKVGIGLSIGGIVLSIIVLVMAFAMAGSDLRSELYRNGYGNHEDYEDFSHYFEHNGL